jgi:hypothetical protein
MKWKPRSRILAELETVPDELRLGEALIWAEIHHMGGNVWIYQQMRLHGGLSIVLPFVDDNRPWFVEFWKETVFWLVKHQAALTNEVTFLILQWALHCHLEARHHNTDGRAFSWKGRSVARCSQSANEYAEGLRKPWAEISWKPRGMEFTWITENDVPWTVHELTTGKDLYEEGQFMSHCVGSYAHHCARGDSAIFSLRKAGQRRITIELNPQNRSLRQAHGRFNSLPSPKEKQVIGRWLRSIAPPPTQSPPT